MKVKCTICGKMVEREICTKLIGLGGTRDGWECPDCDKAARNAEHIETEVERGIPLDR